jgi:uncharacterized protein YdeI (YjbR/CyaY-like superfamily)
MQYRTSPKGVTQMQSEVPSEQLEAECRRLEQEFQQLTAQARRSFCLKEINARKCAKLMERIEQIEEQLSGAASEG